MLIEWFLIVLRSHQELSSGSKRTVVFVRRVNGSLLYALLGLAAVVVLWAPWLTVVLILSTLITVRVQLNDTAMKISTLGGVFHQTIALSDISDIEPGPVTGFWHGAGLRFLGNHMGYLVGGPSVWVHCGAQRVLVSVKDPEEIIAAVAVAKGN